MAKSCEFPDGFVQHMSRRDIAVSFRTLDPQVSTLAARLLEHEGDGIVGVNTSLLDTPELALRALKVNIGGKLPIFDEFDTPPLEQVGETRIIRPEDEFVIVGGPFTNQPRHGFFTVIQRANATDEIDAHTRTRLMCNDFAGIPMDRV